MSEIYLKSLTLKGFKSFATATNLVFEPGITCVVGPNGSGKSNVVDALAWVMGEQGVKTLRGGKMEDVIFAGTATRGPLGRAEVQLTIDNSDGALPIEYTEVTISRTLFRNGASEYAINGEQCRLLDLQELLSDTGLGREMHVIVGQGQLDTVLKASAIERRSFIEEAAGILKYRRRKEKTERKLEAMQANLTRLTDLASELRRQLKPLGRQAEIAQQAQEIAAIQRELRSKLYRIQAGTLSEELDLLSGTEAQRKADLSMLIQQLDATRSSVNQLEAQLISPELEALREKLHKIEGLTQRLRSLENLAASKLTMLQAQSDASPQGELAALTAQATETQAERENAEAELEVLKLRLSDSEVVKRNAEGDLNAFDAEALRRRLASEESQKERAALEASVQVAESRLAGASEQLSALALRLAAATDLAIVKSADFETLGKSLGEDASDNLRQKYDAAQTAEQAAAKSLDEVRERLHALQRERDSASARHAALNLTLDQVDGVQTLSAAKFDGLLGLLADELEIESGYEAAVATALGSLANAVLAKTRGQAISALRFLKNQGAGRVEFVIAEPSVPARAKKLQKGLVLASAVASGPEFVRNILDGFWIADDLETAEAAIASGEVDQLPIITRDGDLISKSLIRGGGSGQPTTIELVTERDKADAELTRLGELIQRAESDLELQREALEKSKNATKSALSLLQEHDAELAARAERVGQLRAQVDAANADRDRVAAEMATVSEAIAALEVDLVSARQALESAPEPIAVQVDESRRTELAAAVESARQLELQVRIEIGAQQERLSAKNAELANLSGRIREANAAIEREKAAAESRARQLEEVATMLKLIPRLHAVTLAAQERTQADKDRLEQERAEQVVRLKQLRAEYQALESRQSAINRDAQDMEIRLHELKLMLTNLAEKVMGDLGLTVENLLSEIDAPAESSSELERELRSIESKIAQLGQFNPLALEEFKALEERHKYLNEQLDDLEKARADLRGIIRDLDARMQQVFHEAFLDTQREFEAIFPVLFPGGSGSLSLTDSGDLLNTGVEVSVRPVGKRIERMSLLSGGERSLAAVALLIAIFKARPSPFYVLDEVEAALDDANLGRLLEVIETLRENSQLIIVTHQKRTMEIADALYGVSMRQDGISAVVGERMERAG